MIKLKPYQLIVLLIFWLLVGCQNDYTSVSFVKVEPECTKLINGIESYQSVDEFKGFLLSSSFQWEEKIKDKPFSKNKPPFNIHTVTIKNYSHLGFSGKLDIGFFNNRLMVTRFYPTDVGKYTEALMKTTDIRFDSNQEAKLPPQTLIRLATDYNGYKYVSWSDIRLDKEVELWIKRYS